MNVWIQKVPHWKHQQIYLSQSQGRRLDLDEEIAASLAKEEEVDLLQIENFVEF